MPILTNHRDAPEQVLQRSAQQDPWVMYLIVNPEAPASLLELLLAATRATMRCSDTLGDHPAWRASFRAWSERSFRKVTLRARGAAWSKVQALEGGAGEVRGIEVIRALPPRLRSECGPLLKGLQVYNPETASLPPDPAPPAELTSAHAMRFVFNPGATMSVGKQVAQIAHAVLMCAGSAWVEHPAYQAAFAAWRVEDYPGAILPSSRWEALLREADGVVVRDAGLTEVEPGTATVLAMPPGYAVPPG
jgi:peptidyl-tRNA hydrolase